MMLICLNKNQYYIAICAHIKLKTYFIKGFGYNVILIATKIY
jgi:hypothetical protein